jgi:hypothetical protein
VTLTAKDLYVSARLERKRSATTYRPESWPSGMSKQCGRADTKNLRIPRFHGASLPEGIPSLTSNVTRMAPTSRLSVIRQWLCSPLLGPGRFFSFVILGWGSSLRKAATYTEDSRNRINAYRQPCLEWDSNARSQSSNWRGPRGHCDRLQRSLPSPARRPQDAEQDLNSSHIALSGYYLMTH